MKRKLFGVISILLLVGALTGCGIKDLLEENNKETENANTKGNCTAVECIKKINPENTVEQINSIIGFDGELTDEKYNIYYWELSEDTGVKVAYYSSNKGTITIDYDRSSIINSKVDFSRYSELKTKVNDGITYDEFITYIGGIDGVITEKSSNSTRYTWVSSNGSYLNGTFMDSSGKCTFITGLIK